MRALEAEAEEARKAVAEMTAKLNEAWATINEVRALDLRRLKADLREKDKRIRELDREVMWLQRKKLDLEDMVERLSAVGNASAGFAREERDRIVKVMNLLGSDQEGERNAAAAKVRDMMKRHGFLWDEIIP